MRTSGYHSFSLEIFGALKIAITGGVKSYPDCRKPRLIIHALNFLTDVSDLIVQRRWIPIDKRSGSKSIGNKQVDEPPAKTPLESSVDSLSVFVVDCHCRFRIMSSWNISCTQNFTNEKPVALLPPTASHACSLCHSPRFHLLFSCQWSFHRRAGRPVVATTSSRLST